MFKSELKKHVAAAAVVIMSACMQPVSVNAQSQLYPQHFDLDEVVLTDGALRTAMITNARLLLQYDADRLMTPFVREAKLSDGASSTSRYYQWETRHPSFPNWGQRDWSLEGHVGGHYVSALALSYAAMKNDSQLASLATQLKNRMDYCVEIMNDCQRAYDQNTDGMRGFIGGQPITQIWTALYSGNIQPYKQWGGWVPFYCQHKVLAGVRDAWVYGGNETARELFRGLSDWSVNVVSKLGDSDMQNVLGNEHGGMNETLADAYCLFGDKKYLDAAKKYSHRTMIDGMQTLDTSFLSGRHANTQVPKYIGFERIYQLDKTATTYRTAARNFWTDVVQNRTVCIGGNSVDEHFMAPSAANRYIDNLNGPESCNTNNMLKLTEDIFDDTHNARYTDFYENAMYNHILSTQDPTTGGYVYFTTLRPQGYKIYSKVNEGMWCCVGTGMENHAKYGHFVYTHDDATTTLYVNLFVPSRLEADNYKLTQETRFPYEEQTTLTVRQAGTYTIAVRHPAWTTADFAVTINGEAQEVSVRAGSATYVRLNRTWKEGDRIEVKLPMQLRIEECPNLSEYIAFKYGPILLAANTSTADLKNEYAGSGRMDHAPGNMASTMSVVTSPLLIGPRAEVLDRIKKTGDLQFTIDASRTDAETAWHTLNMKPFFETHHTRYMIYWYQQTAEQYAQSSLAAEEAKAQAFLQRTIDFVGTGEQQSEAGHQASYSTSSTYGNYNSEIYRDVKAGGYIQYVLANNEQIATDLSVGCRFTTSDRGRVCAIYIEGVKIADYTVPSTYTGAVNGFYYQEFPIPDNLLKDSAGKVKTSLTFRIVASGTTPTPGLYYLRLLKEYSKQYATTYRFNAQDWATTGDANRVAQSRISCNTQDNTITVRATGNNNVCLNFSNSRYTINTLDHYFMILASGVSTADGSAYLWWYNGTNHSSSVKPVSAKRLDNGDVLLVWDINTSGLNDKCTDPTYDFSQGNTIFGLTATAATAIIKYIGFGANMQEPTAINTHTYSNPTTTNIYNLAGQKLVSQQKGINIVDGTKVMVR
ncbi:MAG: glycoside hydrolase family 127 protein [Bacteroidaceae bacterium]|nr:glycoside hydrolase family 127 protein [Bacteroidaceae bacterium]